MHCNAKFGKGKGTKSGRLLWAHRFSPKALTKKKQRKRLLTNAICLNMQDHDVGFRLYTERTAPRSWITRWEGGKNKNMKLQRRVLCCRSQSNICRVLQIITGVVAVNGFQVLLRGARGESVIMRRSTSEPRVIELIGSVTGTRLAQVHRGPFIWNLSQAPAASQGTSLGCALALMDPPPRLTWAARLPASNDGGGLPDVPTAMLSRSPQRARLLPRAAGSATCATGEERERGRISAWPHQRRLSPHVCAQDF